MPQTFNYLYALTYVDFDNKNEDVIYFKNQSAKDSYFNLSSFDVQYGSKKVQGIRHISLTASVSKSE